MPGQIRPVELGVNPLRSKAFNRQCNLNGFTPNLTQFDQALITQFNRSNLTSQIWCKSIEIMTTKFNQAGIHSIRQAYNVISMNFYPIEFDRSNWV